jgi:hypothetical protein
VAALCTGQLLHFVPLITRCFVRAAAASRPLLCQVTEIQRSSFCSLLALKLSVKARPPACRGSAGSQTWSACSRLPCSTAETLLPAVHAVCHAGATGSGPNGGCAPYTLEVRDDCVVTLRDCVVREPAQLSKIYCITASQRCPVSTFYLCS